MVNHVKTKITNLIFLLVLCCLALFLVSTCISCLNGPINKKGLKTPSLKDTKISLVTLYLYKPGLLANGYQVLKCSFVLPDAMTGNILW
jgi:hypothetical protein